MDLGRTFTVFERTETRNSSPVSFLVGRTETHLKLTPSKTREHSSASDPETMAAVSSVAAAATPHAPPERETSSSDPSPVGKQDPFGGYTGKLKNILHALSLFDPEVGYCQGINFITALLLVQSSGSGVLEEEDVFWLLVSILRKFHLAGLFMEDARF